MADRFPSFVFTATFATIFGWLAPAAVGDDPANHPIREPKPKLGRVLREVQRLRMFHVWSANVAHPPKPPS